MTLENQTAKTDRSKAQSSKELFWLMTIGIFILIAFHVSPFYGLSVLIWFQGAMAALAVVAFINASILLGYKHAVVFLILGAVIGWSLEHLGVLTGAVFGPYSYTAKLGFKIGAIPWVIPLCWFGIVYFAHVIANLILSGTPVLRANTVLQACLFSILTGLVATCMDMALDPALSHPEVLAWIWTDGGQYFGVPFKNFGGWVVTAFLIDICYRLYARRSSAKPNNKYAKLSGLYAILAWGGLGFSFMIIGYPVETQLTAIFCVILPALLALVKVLNVEAMGLQKEVD